MAIGLPKEIPLYVQKIEAAAKQRQDTEDRLQDSGKELQLSDRFRAEAKIRKYNLDIAEYAEKINAALRALSKGGPQRVDPIRVPTSITDPQLKRYLNSVKRTVDKLDESRLGDLDRKPRDEKQLSNRLDEAQRMVKQANRAIKQVEAERTKVEGQLKKLRKQLEDRRRQVKPIDGRIHKAKGDRSRIEAQIKKFGETRAKRFKEKRKLEQRKRAAELKRKQVQKPADRRQQRELAEDCKKQIDEIEHWVKQNIDFRETELGKVKDQFDHELEQLEEAKKNAERDFETIKGEIERLVGYEKDYDKRLGTEKERLD
ncbi:MAG: coiled-coil domain-containing protein, partial [Planctomycetota bacterium]